jgi:hypothetical protein
MGALHPVFQEITQSFTQAQLTARQSQIDAYVQLLRSHDWQFAAADDGFVYRRGLDERRTLQMLQCHLDPDRSLWKMHEPADCRSM